MHDQAAQARAALASGTGGREHDRPRAQSQIRSWRNNGGIVASELKQRAAEASRGRKTHRAAHRRAAGGADERDGRVRCQLLAGRAATLDQLRETLGGFAVGGQRLLEQLMQGQGAQWGLVGGLPQERIAANQRERCVPGPDRHREIKGADDGDRAQRVPALEHVMTGPL